MPGEKGRLWDECKQAGDIAIGWNELGDLSGLDRDGFDARLDAALTQFPSWKRRGVEQAWRFINIPEGARIVAASGTRHVLGIGIGTVTGPYRFVEDGREFAHRLPVEWDDTRERAFDMTGLTSAEVEPHRRRTPPPRPKATTGATSKASSTASASAGSVSPTTSSPPTCSPSRPSASSSSPASPAPERPSWPSPSPGRFSPAAPPKTPSPPSPSSTPTCGGSGSSPT